MSGGVKGLYEISCSLIHRRADHKPGGNSRQSRQSRTGEKGERVRFDDTLRKSPGLNFLF